VVVRREQRHDDIDAGTPPRLQFVFEPIATARTRHYRQDFVTPASDSLKRDLWQTTHCEVDDFVLLHPFRLLSHFFDHTNREPVPYIVVKCQARKVGRLSSAGEREVNDDYFSGNLAGADDKAREVVAGSVPSEGLEILDRGRIGVGYLFAEFPAETVRLALFLDEIPRTELNHTFFDKPSISERQTLTIRNENRSHNRFPLTLGFGTQTMARTDSRLSLRESAFSEL